MLTIDAQSDNRPVPTGQVEQHSILVQQAFTAIDAAASVEEVKKVLDQWAGLAAYARAAKEKQLEADAAEIKMRAERRLGEMMRAQKETVGFHKGGRPKTGSVGDPVSEPKGTLAEAGIDKHLADSARKEAAKSKEQFEDDVAEKKSGILDKRKAVLDLGADVEVGGVAPPETVKANLLDTISRHCNVVRAYKRIIKAREVSSFDREMKEEISCAIGVLIRKWQSLQATLAPRPASNGEAPAPATAKPAFSEDLDLRGTFLDRRKQAGAPRGG